MEANTHALTPDRHTDASFFIDIAALTLADPIAGGASSIVYRGTWHRCPVAVKKWFDPTCAAQTLREFHAELLTVRRLRHPNIVPFYAACAQPPDLCLVMEHLPTSLFDLLHNTRLPIDDRRICAMAIDIARALLYLHAQTPPIIHRDVKPANLLLDRAWRVKLCDFGLASALPHQRHAGTVAYMAPELLDPDGTFNAAVDVYAFGIVLNEILTGRMPFETLDENAIRRCVMHGDRPIIPISCPPPLRRLIESCWQHDARNRPVMMDVHNRLQHYLIALKNDTSTRAPMPS